MADPREPVATGGVPSEASAGEDAPAVVAPPPGNPRFPLLDSVRALAALGVIFTHVFVATQVVETNSWGAVLGFLDIGVTVFFALSGFLLFRPWFAAQAGLAPATPLSAYARRRFLRIVPAYWLALTILALLSGPGSLPGVFSGDWWRYYAFLEFYAVRTSLAWGIAWTLCVEVAFYAVLPLYAHLTAWLTRRLSLAGRIRVQLVLLTALGVASLALRAGDRGTVMQNSLATHLLWFAAGMILAVLSVSLQAGAPLPRAARVVRALGAHPGVSWAAAAAVYLALCLAVTSAPDHLFLSTVQDEVHHVLSAVFAMLVMIPAVFGSGRSWPRRVLGLPWLAWLGLISYGLYLWNESLLEFATHHGVNRWWLLLPLTTLATVAVAAASYYVVERPLLRAKFTAAERRERPDDSRYA